MEGLHLRSIPGTIWPGVPRGEVSQLWAMFLELDRTQWLDPAEVLAGQLAQVRSLLKHCQLHVPYYSDLFRKLRLDPDAIRSLDDFQRIPSLSRRTFQEQAPRFQARELPAGTMATTRMKSSGTSGMPIEVGQTNLVNLWWFAFHLRDLHWCGLDLRGSLAVIRGLSGAGGDPQAVLEGVQQPFWSRQLHAVVETGPSFVMDVHQEPRRQLDWLRRVNSDYLLSYPPNLEHLASLLAEAGERLPNLRAILSIGETLTEEARGRIEVGFGVPVKNTYSCVEAGYLASPCPEGHGLHVHAENVLLEVIDEQDRPCLPGQPGRVVLTPLHNFLTPLVRYEILDAATPGPERCSCGRGLPLLRDIQGKRRPQFCLPDGRRKDSGFLVRRLRQVGGYHQHQIIQRTPAHLVVRLVAGRAWTEDHAGQIVRAVQDYFEAPVNVDVELVDSIASTAAGKLRDVLVETDLPAGP